MDSLNSFCEVLGSPNTIYHQIQYAVLHNEMPRGGDFVSKYTSGWQENHIWYQIQWTIAKIDKCAII